VTMLSIVLAVGKYGGFDGVRKLTVALKWFSIPVASDARWGLAHSARQHGATTTRKSSVRNASASSADIRMPSRFHYEYQIVAA